MKLRKLKELDQNAVAEKVGLTQPAYSRLERGERPITGAVADRLSRVLALGEQARGERTPHFCLASESPDRALDLVFVRGTHPEFDHLGLFRRRRTADQVARLLCDVGELPIVAVPVWLEFAAVALARRLGHAPASDQLFEVDGNENPAVRAQTALQHGLQVLDAHLAERQHSRVAAELAASFAGGAT